MLVELMNQSREGIVTLESVQPGRGVRSGGQRGSGEIACDIGALIINADDWGRDSDTTDLQLECILNRAVSSVSAMVFMKDSERSALLGLRHGVDAGLHLNFTTPFTMPGCSSKLIEHQERCARFLKSHRFAPIVYHPGLTASFRYVTEAQLDEFERLYGHRPERVDGHHHMHLCANVLLGGLLPQGIIVRRNFSFRRGEKGPFNRAYRHWQDRALARHNRAADFFFSLPPLNPRSRLEDICALADRYNVEVETHPSNPEEFRFLMSGELSRCAGEVKVAQGYRMCIGVEARTAEGYS